jgi:hypothetical protein
MLATQNHIGHLYIWGVSHYRDVFEESPIHTTMFCTEITDVTGNLTSTGPVNIQTASCNHGNCYDTECSAK